MTFFLTLLFMFLVFWRPQEWLAPWMFGWPVLDVIVCGALLCLLLERSQERGRAPLNVPSQVYLLGWLWVATLMSHIAHAYFAGLMQTYYETFKFCLLSALLFLVIRRVTHLRLIAGLFVGMAFFMAIHAIMQQRTGAGFSGQPPIWSPRLGSGGLVSRSVFFGIFDDPNDLAQFLAAALPFAFAVPKKLTWCTLPLVGGVAWMLVEAILATESRGGLIALVTAGGLIMLLVLPKRWVPTLGVLLILGSLFAFPIGAGMLDESARERVVFWGDANRAFKSTPLFGVGYGMLADYVEGGGRATHNAFVACYGEVGIFGYIPWFLLAFLGILGAWRTQMIVSRNPEVAWLRRYAGLALASLVSFLTSSYFLSRTFVYPYFFLVATTGMIATLAERLLPRDHPPVLRVTMRTLLLGSACALGSIAYIYASILILNKAYGG